MNNACNNSTISYHYTYLITKSNTCKQPFICDGTNVFELSYPFEGLQLWKLAWLSSLDGNTPVYQGQDAHFTNAHTSDYTSSFQRPALISTG